MFTQGDKGSLNSDEKRIVKLLVEEGWTNQDIQALINLERPATINFGRIAGVKKDLDQPKASRDELENYTRFKRSFDLKTGLNPFCDERLIKSREAMKLAVTVFNNPTFQFRAENFSMLAVVGWTYLVLEYSSRNGMPMERKNGKAISLADFLKQGACPFSEGVKNNLKALIKIRDQSEHVVLGPHDESWVGIFQASCMNYEREIVGHFGARLSLSSEIAFALQFSGLSIGQASQMAGAPLPEKIQAINAELFDGLSDEQKNDQEFQFSVIYTTVAASKSKAAIQFVVPGSAEGKEIENVLVKHKPSHITHPLKPTDVVSQVKKKSQMPFNMSSHTRLWKKHKVRPKSGSENPEKTNLDYCYYHPTYRSYSYNETWVDLIVKEMNAQAGLA